MRGSLLSRWALPLFLAILANAILFLWIPFLSHTKRLETPRDFSDPFILFDHQPHVAPTPPEETVRIVKQEEPSAQQPQPSRTAPEKTQRTTGTIKEEKTVEPPPPKVLRRFPAKKKLPAAPAKAPSLDAPADEKSGGPSIPNLEPAAISEVSSRSGEALNAMGSGSG